MKTILIVEDDQSMALVLEARLKAAGYDVTVVADSVSAVNTAKQLRPDLLLLDISISMGDGFLVAERIRTDRATVSTPFMFVTASTNPNFRRKAKELGAAGYFVKPYPADDLLDAIKTVLAA